MVASFDADMGKPHESGAAMAEDIRRRISDVCINQPSGYDAMSIEGLLDCKMGPGKASIVGVAPGKYH